MWPARPRGQLKGGTIHRIRDKMGAGERGKMGHLGVGSYARSTAPSEIESAEGEGGLGDSETPEQTITKTETENRVPATRLLLILTYGCELYPEPSEQQRRLANEVNRWIVGAYRGSREDKVRELCGVSELGYLAAAKGRRWAASVYGRHLPELREIAEPMLRWMKGALAGQARITIVELDYEEVEEWPERTVAEVAGVRRELRDRGAVSGDDGHSGGCRVSPGVGRLR